MPFAGHPALGTAHVVQDVVQTGDSLTLEFKAGVIPVSVYQDVWTFAAPYAGKPKTAASPLADGSKISRLMAGGAGVVMRSISVEA